MSDVPEHEYEAAMEMIDGRDAEIEKLTAEIERLTVAKRQQTKMADLRSAENVKLRHVLKGIAEFCSGDDTTLGAIARLAHIRNTVDQALRARDVEQGVR